VRWAGVGEGRTEEMNTEEDKGTMRRRILGRKIKKKEI
jgi:hypothetical protein